MAFENMINIHVSFMHAEHFILYIFLASAQLVSFWQRTRIYMYN